MSTHEVSQGGWPPQLFLKRNLLKVLSVGTKKDSEPFFSLPTRLPTLTKNFDVFADRGNMWDQVPEVTGVHPSPGESLEVTKKDKNCNWMDE